MAGESEDDLFRFLDRETADAVFGERRRRAQDNDPEFRAEPAVASPAISLMITNRQRAALRSLGFSDAAIRAMTPAEAHGYLGLDKPER
jgi:hypothetical protein